MAVNFFGPQDRGELRPATCELRLFHESDAAQRHLNPRRPATCHLRPASLIYCLIWTLAVVPPMAMPCMVLCFTAGHGQCPLRPQSGYGLIGNKTALALCKMKINFLLSRFLKNRSIRFIAHSFLLLNFRHIQRNDAVFVKLHISHIAVFPFQIFMTVGHAVRDFQLVPFDDCQTDFREKAAGEADEFFR